MTWLTDLAERARSVVPEPVWTHLAAGALEEVTAGEAVGAWQGVRFAPRVLRDVSSVDTTLRLLGSDVGTPIGVAPTSMQRAVHPEGERATACGARAAGALHVVSSNAGFPFSEIDAGAPWWLQAYLPPVREDAAPVLEGAVAAGARAVVLTVDTPYPGTKYAVSNEEEWAGIDVSWFRCNFAEPASFRWADDVTFDDIGWLRDRTALPVVVKGVLRPDDAHRSVQAGASAVWVSNHGGRQLDRAISTRAALPAVVAAVAGSAEVYVDGGIRSGLDALAAIALGADAAFVGRPVLHALAVDGADGVERLLRDLTAELVEALQLAGCRALADAPDLVHPPGVP